MPWIFFAVAAAALVVAFRTGSVALLMACLLVSFGLTIAGFVRLLSQRVASRSQDETLMIDPLELERLRRQAPAAPTEDVSTLPQ